MKKQKTNIKQIFAAVVIAVAAFMPSTALAWGPERTTYTNQSPADHVTFNSITNNAGVGDERNFVRVREAGVGTFEDEVAVEPGKEYEVYVYYHNNAASNLNDSGKGIATGVRLKTQFPSTVTPSQKGQISAIIAADNAEPASVWDEAYMTTSVEKVTLRYKTGSAKIYNAGAVNGKVLSQRMFTESGTYIGYDTLDGRIPGCAEYSGYIMYTLVADEVGAEVSKLVSTDGTNFYESVEAKPGDTVYYKVEFKNTGTKSLTNVTFKDTMPEGLTLIEGSTTMFSDKYTEGRQMTDLIDKNGYNVGEYGAGTYATWLYKAKVSESASCATMVNKMAVSYDGGEISDGATVTVGNCMPGEIPSTGPAEIVLVIVVVGGMGIGGAYFIRSRRQLKEIERKL